MHYKVKDGTWLRLAASAGHTGLVTKFLDMEESSINFKDDLGRTARFLAEQNGYPETGDYLKSRGGETVVLTTTVYMSYDTQHVKEKYPCLPDWLQFRIGAANTQRRHYISFRRDYNTALAASAHQKSQLEIAASKADLSLSPTRDEPEFCGQGGTKSNPTNYTSISATTYGRGPNRPLYPFKARGDHPSCPYCRIGLSSWSLMDWR
jgi:hypothetical protein